jgi:predicted membrane protein
LIYEGIVGRPALRVFYALIVISALLFSSHRQVQIFGGLILTSVLFTYWAFPHAFISVWCYFAAILSAYVLAMLWHARHKRTAAVRSASP